MPSETSKPSPKLSKNLSSGAKHPLILVLFVSAVLLTGIIGIAFGHKFGYHQGYQASQNEAKVKGENQELSIEEARALQEQVKSLNKQMESAKVERDISLNNLGQMRNDIQELEIKNLQLNQVNNVFAEQLIENGGLPLQIVGAKMEPLPENAFEYRFDIAMLSEDGTQHRLTPKLTLLDEENLVEVPLEPRYYDIKGISRIRGRFVMPKGFRPKQAKLELKADGQEVEQIYDWRLSKPVDEMPMSLSEVPETDQRPVSSDE